MYKFSGTHIIIDAFEITSDKFENVDLLEDEIERSINEGGATLIKLISHRFPIEGFTIMAMLQESHVTIHAYPESRAMFIDAFTCGQINPSIITNCILSYIVPVKTRTTVIERGL